MPSRKQIPLAFVIDKITNSIENVHTGESISTEIVQVTLAELNSATKKNGWVFDWKYEFKQADRAVYKLIIPEIPSVIHGLISLETKSDHIYMHLVESADFNKGKGKKYAGVPGNLVAFACLQAFRQGFDGNVSFISKTQLIDHYVETLGAFHFGGRVMIIETRAALKLTKKYFKDQPL